MASDNKIKGDSGKTKRRAKRSITGAPRIHAVTREGLAATYPKIHSSESEMRGFAFGWLAPFTKILFEY